MYKQNFDSKNILSSLNSLNAKHSDPYTTIVKDYQKLCKELTKKPKDFNQGKVMSIRSMTQTFNNAGDSDLNSSQVNNDNASQTLLNTVVEQRDRIKDLEKESAKLLEMITTYKNKIKCINKSNVF